jgi:hypothetical protein
MQKLGIKGDREIKVSNILTLKAFQQQSQLFSNEQEQQLQPDDAGGHRLSGQQPSAIAAAPHSLLYSAAANGLANDDVHERHPAQTLTAAASDDDAWKSRGARTKSVRWGQSDRDSP